VRAAGGRCGATAGRHTRAKCGRPGEARGDGGQAHARAVRVAGGGAGRRRAGTHAHVVRAARGGTGRRRVVRGGRSEPTRDALATACTKAVDQLTKLCSSPHLQEHAPFVNCAPAHTHAPN